MVSLFCTIGFHNWETLGNKRKCNVCGATQQYRIDEVGWEWMPDPLLCPTCFGEGRVYNERFEKVPCSTCKGKGKVRYDN